MLRLPLISALVFSGIAGPLYSAAEKSAADVPPSGTNQNIVFILADDLSYCSVACYGDPYL